jgi:hypothetical protein
VSGVKYTLGASSTNVCNGKNGANGTTGFTATLPSEQTETGTYFLAGNGGKGPYLGLATTPISIPIPLEAAIGETNTHFITKGGDASACENEGHPGEPSSGNPEAPPGVLCVFEAGLSSFVAWTDPVEFVNMSTAVGSGAGTTGTMLARELPADPVEAAEVFSYGTWAVTAP